MSSRADKFDDAKRERDPRECERQAGIESLSADARELGPQILALQKSVLAGLAGSQAREAKRLEQRGADRQRVARIAERAARMETIRADLLEAETAVRNVVDGFQQPGIFHGYVRQASGAPAAGYTVSVVGIRQTKTRLAAKTDESGYFRMVVDAPTPQVKAKASAAAPAPSRSAAATPRTQSKPPPAPPPPPPSPPPPPRGAAVEVADPAGRTVLRDPVPITFEDKRRSEFRIYPLLGKEFGEVEPEPDPNSGEPTPVPEPKRG